MLYSINYTPSPSFSRPRYSSLPVALSPSSSARSPGTLTRHVRCVSSSQRSCSSTRLVCGFMRRKMRRRVELSSSTLSVWVSMGLTICGRVHRTEAALRLCPAQLTCHQNHKSLHLTFSSSPFNSCLRPSHMRPLSPEAVPGLIARTCSCQYRRHLSSHSHPAPLRPSRCLYQSGPSPITQNIHQETPRSTLLTSALPQS